MQYKITGDTLPVVILTLENGESVITEGGAMSWMSPNMQMQTSGGGIGKVFGRAFAGESLFQNIYKAEGGQGLLACASRFPGAIKAFEIMPGRPMIFQKSAFLCSEPSISLSVFFQKKIGAGIFGGEGFIMQKVEGNGICFAEFDGNLVEYDLVQGQQLIVSTGHVAAMDATCTIDIQRVKGVKNALLGGEGFFNTLITGPGHVWLQTMPLYNVANALKPFLPSGN